MRSTFEKSFPLRIKSKWTQSIIKQDVYLIFTTLNFLFTLSIILAKVEEQTFICKNKHYTNYFIACCIFFMCDGMKNSGVYEYQTFFESYFFYLLLKYFDERLNFKMKILMISCSNKQKFV